MVEISNSNPFGGLASGGGGINTSGGGYNPPQTNFLGAVMDMRRQAGEDAIRQQQVDLAKAKLLEEQQRQEADKRMSAWASMAYDPDSGEINMPEFLTHVAGDPLTQPRFTDAYTYAIQSGKTTSEIMKNRVSAAGDKAAGLGRAAFGVLEVAAKEGRDPTGADVAAAISNQITLGNLSASEGKKLLNSLKPDGPQLTAQLKQFSLEANQSKEALDRTMGVITTQPTADSSGTEQVVTGLGGQQTKVPGSERKNVLTPGEQIQTQKVIGPDGREHTLTGAQIAGATGRGDIVPGGAAGGTSSGELGVGPTPRETQETAETVKSNAAFKEQVNTESEQAGVNKGMLRLAQHELKNIRTGGGASYNIMASNVAQALGAPEEVYNAIANGSKASSEIVSGLNTLLSVRNFKAVTEQANRDLGQMEFARMIGSGFSIDNSKEANNKIINYMLGAQELRSKRADALQAWTKSGKSVEDFRPAWQKKEREWIQRGILRNPDDTISLADYKKGKRAEGF